MKQFVTIVLTIGLFLVGLPFQLCVCGCGVSESDETASAQTSCCHHSKKSESNEPTPCGCEHCSFDLAVPLDKPVAVDVSNRVSSYERVVDVAQIDVEMICPRSDAPSPEPDRRMGSTDRPITILLGQLLL